MIVTIKFTDDAAKHGVGFKQVTLTRDEWRAMPFETVEALAARCGLPVVDFRVESWTDQEQEAARG